MKYNRTGKICIYSIAPLQAGCDTISFFPPDSLNSEVSFSLIGYLTKAKEPHLLYSLLGGGEENLESFLS